MPLLAVVIAFFVASIPAFIFKVVTSLGVGVVTYIGYRILFTQLENAVLSQVGSIAPEIGAFLNIAGYNIALSMLLSAMSIKLTLSIVNGAISKMTFTNKSLPAP